MNGGETRNAGISVEELLFAFAGAAMIFGAFLYDIRLLFAVPVIAGVVVFLGKPSLVIYPLVLFAFLRLDAWISAAASVPFGKVLFLFTATAMAAVVLLTGTRLNRPTVPACLFVLFLVTYFVFGIAEATGVGAVLWLEDSIYAVTYFAVVYLLVNRWDRLEKVISLIVLSGLIVSVVNIVEFFYPSLLGMSHSFGRSAGLLKNANVSAFIVNLAMIASLYWLWTAKGKRMALAMIATQILFFFGVFTTFSREGMLLFVLIFLGQFVCFKHSFRRALVVIVAGAIIALGVVQIAGFIMTDAESDVRFSFQKLTMMVEGRIDDNDRLWLLDFHLKRFLQRPLTGHGLYSALLYSVPSTDVSRSGVPNGPHNTFALILSEAGIVPAVMYLAVLVSFLSSVAVARRTGGDVRGRAMKLCLVLMFCAVVIHHFFSHMLLLARYPMILFALFALPERVCTPKLLDEFPAKDIDEGNLA